MNNNSIMTIRTFRYNGGWVFDDAAVGLTKEPFVAGADTAIETLAKGADAVNLIFSAIPFPGHKLVLDRVKGGPQDGGGGTDYHCKELNQAMWLCPALNLYFPVSPNKVYVDYKAEKK